MKIFFKFFLLFISIINFQCDKAKRNINNQSKPNIILILADDFGIMDSQGYAEKFSNFDRQDMFYETPNINRLIDEGSSFSQAYASQLCSPTRASLMTGIYPSKIGFTTAMGLRKTFFNQSVDTKNNFYIHDVFEHKDKIDIEQALTNAISNSAIPKGDHDYPNYFDFTITDALKEYRSAFIGKWHLGGFGAKGYQPEDFGFEPIAWYDHGSSSYYDWRKTWQRDLNKFFPKLSRDEFNIGDPGIKSNEPYLTDDLTKKALGFIELWNKKPSKPFFLFFSHFAVHTPIQGKKDESDYFKNKKTKGWNNHHNENYASMIKSLDDSIGEILNKLEELQILDNTLVIFMSDNGGIDSKITPNSGYTDNSPFLGGKACLTEGGIRIPLIFMWKNKIPANKWIDIPVDCTDILPTLVSLAGGSSDKIIKKYNLDGENFVGLFSDNKNLRKSYMKKTRYWHYPFNVIYNNPLEPLPLTPHSAIRDGDYKLIFDWYGRFYLFDISKDPYEKNNLHLENIELSNKLFQKLMSWLKNNVDKRYWPSINKNYIKKNELRKQPFEDLFSEFLE